MQRSTQRVNKTHWFYLAGNKKLKVRLAIRLYGKGLIYLRPTFRQTKLAFLRARAKLKGNTITAPKF